MKGNKGRFLNFLFSTLPLWITVLSTACTVNPLTALTVQQLSQSQLASVTAHFCTSPRINGTNQTMKYIFVIDKSAYNQYLIDVQSPDVSGADPNGSKRFSAIDQFVQNLINQNLGQNSTDHTYFTVIDFNDNPTQLAPPGGTAGFTNIPQDFLTLVDNDWIGQGSAAAPHPRDSGFTDYVKALKMVIDIVSTDAPALSPDPTPASSKPTYVVIFISGGMPMIAQANGTIYQQTWAKDIQGMVSTLMDLPKKFSINQINLHTAYYAQSTSITPITDILTNMATAGKGQYFQLGNGAGITYARLSPPFLNLKSKLMDVFVENKNLVWWDDGTLRLDSDGDGLPDTLEAQIGSNPFLSDSDGNGVSDLIEYRLTGKPCESSTCTQTGSNPFIFCSGLNPTTGPNQGTVYPDSDQDGLNDCEEFLLKSNRLNFSTSNDFIPDFLAFKNAIPIILGLSGSHASPLGDGMTNYAKLKLGLPTTVASQLNTYQVRSTDLQRVDDGPDDQDCYQMTVAPLATQGISNTIRISILENSIISNDNPTLRIAEKKFNPYEFSLSFGPEDFH